MQHMLFLGTTLAALWSAQLFAAPAEIRVFAAASLTESLKEIAGAYQKISGDKVTFSFGASSLLARQIQEGAPADLFFSADEAKMNDLEKRGLIIPETWRSRLSNTLVILVANDSTLKLASPEDLAKPFVKHIALADPKGVPAGIYAKEFLKSRKLWAAVEPKVIPTENVRAALSAVESGNVDAGIVYRTDVEISKKVKVVCEISRNEGPAISYPVAVMKAAPNASAARKFLEYLNSPEATQAFERHGFVALK